MPANLTPEYRNAEMRFRQARTPEEKLDALHEMLAVIPKHKGTEKLQADLRTRISKLRHQQDQKKQKGVRAAAIDHIEREGAGQVALVGMPNSGKSSILKAVTNANPEVAEYPFSTLKPLPGMMAFEDVQIQLIDLPPLSMDYMESWVLNVIRKAELISLVVDLSSPSPEEEVLAAMEILEEGSIWLVGKDEEESQRAHVRGISKKTIILGAKCDVEDPRENVQNIREMYGEEFPIVPVSAQSGEGLEDMARKIFQALDILRVYTKVPGKKADLRRPYILPVESTVQDLARSIHREFVGKLRYARIWGSEKYDGQKVQQDYRIADKDIIEIHVR